MSVEFAKNFIAVSFLFWRGNISGFCFLLRHSLDVWLLPFTSGNHSITQHHSLTPVGCEYTTANLLEHTIWSLCQLVFLCDFYIVCTIYPAQTFLATSQQSAFSEAELGNEFITYQWFVFWGCGLSDFGTMSLATDLVIGTHNYLISWPHLYLFFAYSNIQHSNCNQNSQDKINIYVEQQKLKSLLLNKHICKCVFTWYVGHHCR